MLMKVSLQLPSSTGVSYRLRSYRAGISSCLLNLLYSGNYNFSPKKIIKTALTVLMFLAERVSTIQRQDDSEESDHLL